jgi:hypothetical protein
MQPLPNSPAMPLPTAQNSAAEWPDQIAYNYLIYNMFPSQREDFPRAETRFVPELREMRAEAA